MSWNYRIIKRTFEMPDGHKENQYAVYEVYYDIDGLIKARSLNPICVAGETLEELAKDLELYAEALNKPVLDWGELEGK